jgi:predicted Na+-dependent transporter
MRRRLADSAGAYPELLLVAGAATVGLLVGAPLRRVDSHQGINVFLAVLVLATAFTVPIAALGRVASVWRQVLATLAVGGAVLPVVSWLASRVVSAGSLRDGVMCIGLAPCEIASVATTAMAGGEAATAAAVLIGSTLLSVTSAGVILSVEVSGAHVHPGHILVNLAIVVAAPMAAGLVLRAAAGSTPRRDAGATRVATGALAVLVALVAAQVHLGWDYLPMLAAVAIVIAVSAGLAVLLGRTTSADQAIPILLTLSMRDFAIAAGLATAAFGAAAAGPLGLYGVVVIVWGTAVAGRQRSKRGTL